MNTRNLQKCRIAGVACLAVLLVYLAAGCQTVSTSGQSNPAQTGETKPGAVTFYGIVNRGQVQAVRLPFAVQISAWLVREGEQVADQRALLQLDLEPLRQKYRDLERQQKKLRGTAEVLQAQANWTGQRIAAVQAALQVDLEPGLDSLDKWYRATSRTRRSQYAAELRLFLTSLESLDLYGSLLTLTRDLGDGLTVFYNGPRCGASAPDHHHFQVCPAGTIPVEKLWEENGGKRRELAGGVSLGIREMPGRTVLAMEGGNQAAVADALVRLLPMLGRAAESDSDAEPMLILLCHYQDKRWRLLLFPRRRHRPAAYYREGEEAVLVTPGAVEMGGLLITVREEDFLKMNFALAEEIYREVALEGETVEKIFGAFPA